MARPQQQAEGCKTTLHRQGPFAGRIGWRHTGAAEKLCSGSPTKLTHDKLSRGAPWQAWTVAATSQQQSQSHSTDQPPTGLPWQCYFKTGSPPARPLAHTHFVLLQAPLVYFSDIANCLCVLVAHSVYFLIIILSQSLHSVTMKFQLIAASTLLALAAAESATTATTTAATTTTASLSPEASCATKCELSFARVAERCRELGCLTCIIAPRWLHGHLLRGSMLPCPVP